jgi:predicted RNase H-like HicB family nuclease
MKKRMATIQLTHMIRVEGEGEYSAFCDELGLATCAGSFEEAKRRITKATIMVLNAATEKGEILDLLKGKGIPIYFAKLITHHLGVVPQI